MSNGAILTNPTDAELAIAVEENLFDLFRAMAATLPDAEIVETPTLSYHLTPPSNPMFKGIWHTAEATDALIEETLDWFRARQAPFAFWWVGPRTTPADLPARLLAHGFIENIVGDPGMGVDLHALPEAVTLPEGLMIRKADTPQMLADWRDVFVATFEVPQWAGQAWMDATLAAGIEQAHWTLYVGYLNGQPVATNILVNGGGAAGLFGVGTLPAARGRGIGTAITLQPLLDARAQGYHAGVLFATEMGHPVYQKMGFRDVPCKIGRYLWINGSLS